jgi:hypothetical protein
MADVGYLWSVLQYFSRLFEHDVRTTHFQQKSRGGIVGDNEQTAGEIMLGRRGILQ